MGDYYLIAQLPSLDGVGEDSPLPIEEERFLELCRRFLKKKPLGILEDLTLVPSLNAPKALSALAEKWNEGERDLRLCLAKARAQKLKKEYEGVEKSVSPALVSLAKAAVEIENPLEAERFLLKHRLQFLESLRPSDPFCEEYLYYYWLKLKLLSRVRGFDAQAGKSAYRTIYDSILNGEQSEAES